MKEILGTALDLPPHERRPYVVASCAGDPHLQAEVEALLEYSDDAAAFIEQPAIAAGVELLDRNDAESMLGRIVGRYRIVELIGEGGVGAVYRAVYADGEFERQIAIKLLKRGMDSAAILRRFRDERRILARLDHPNIAKFLDGGILEDGRPYFVMEYLQGTPINEYSRKNNLSVRERLNLFLPVCSAVAYSHRNLVIHRDLKTTNILVTADGIPRLLDFGIAKLLDRDTSGSLKDATLPIDRMMTPDYASPEQIRGETLTTASDVYSLGVLLYELLTDRRPHQLSGIAGAEMIRVVESEPPKPSAVAPKQRAREIAGDLDTIVAKAMRRTPERRYASAQQLADDIRRYILGLPVHARPDTVVYRLSKYASRHRAGFAMAALSFVAVSAGLFTAVWQSGVAAAKEREAQKRFSEVRHLANGLLGEVDGSLENLPGATAAREILARRVSRYLDILAREEVRDISLQREVAVAYERLGEILGASKTSNLGKTGDALAAYRQAVAIHGKIAQTNPDDPTYARDRARALSKYSDLLAVTGDHLGAFQQEEKALAIRQAWLNADPKNREAKRAVASSIQELAGDLDRLGRYGEALETRRKVLGLLQELDSSASAHDSGLRMALALAHKRLGRSLVRANRVGEALPHFEQAIAIERTEVGRNPVSTVYRAGLGFSLSDLGIALAQKGDYTGAISKYRESLEIRLGLAKADLKDWRASNLVASTRLRLGSALLRTGAWLPGLRELRRSLELRKELFSRSPRNLGAKAEVAEAQAALADAYAERKLWKDAVPLYREAHGTYTNLRQTGSLTAELRGEPERIAGALERARE